MDALSDGGGGFIRTVQDSQAGILDERPLGLLASVSKVVGVGG